MLTRILIIFTSIKPMSDGTASHAPIYCKTDLLTLQVGIHSEFFDRYINGALAGEPQKFCTNLQFPDQKTRYLEVHYLPDKNTLGHVIAIMVIMYEISDTSRRQSVTHHNQIAYQTILDYCPNGVIQVDQHLRFQTVNRAYCEFIATRIRIVKAFVYDLAHPDDLDELRLKAKRLSQSANILKHYSHRYFHKNGTIVWEWLLAAQS